MNQKLNSILSFKRIFILLANYFIGYMFLYPLLLNILYYEFHLSNEAYNILTFFVYVWMIMICLIASFPLLKESYQNLPNMKKFFESILLIFVIIYFVSGFSNAIITLISGLDTSENQNQVIQAFNQNPMLITFTTLIYAPIVEEIVFRGAIFRSLRSKTNFIFAALISAFTFGMIHVFDSLLMGNFQDLWYLFTYGSLGFIFCYAYEKNHSILGSMSLHFLNNFIGILFMIIAGFIA